MTSEEAMLHSILYAKGWYKSDDKLTGLRVIAGHYSLMDPEYITDEHLMHYMLMLLEKYRPSTSVTDVVTGVFREAWKWRRDASPMKPQGTITQLDVVEYVMSELRYLRVTDIPGTLPQADANIYPLREK